MSRIAAVATAVPRLRMTQSQVWKFLRENAPMEPATKRLYERVLAHPGVWKRHFAFDHPREALETDLDRIHAKFEKQAVAFSARSLKKALALSRVRPRDLDFLAVSTCTGYLCPGIGSQLIEPCGLRADLRFVEVVGMGCGGALPALEQCHNFLVAHPQATVAAVATEICSAASFWGDSADLVVSNSLFADGSGAAVLQNGSRQKGPRLLWFSSRTYPAWKDTLRFRMEEGRLRNILGKEVPDQVARAAQEILRDCSAKRLLDPEKVSHWILHSGGTKILDAVERSLGIGRAQTSLSRRILRRYGNLSSATVFYLLHDLIRSGSPQPGEIGIILAYGAGFTVHACLIEF